MKKVKKKTFLKGYEKEWKLFFHKKGDGKETKPIFGLEQDS